MSRHIPLKVVTMFIFFFFTLAALYFSRLKFWSKPESLHEPIRSPNQERISYFAHSDGTHDIIGDNTPWFSDDGTPLFYAAWRALSPEPTQRSSIKRYGARVACWPSSGGIWIKNVDPVELSFLRLSNSQDEPRQFNQTAEDEFCTKLRMVGAEWWQLPPDFESRSSLGEDKFRCRTLEECFAPQIRNNFLFGWPEDTHAGCYISYKHAHATSSTLLGYGNALDMDQRCDAILKLGGKWCRCKDECPEIKYLDWGERDLGSDGCADPPIIMDYP